MLKKNLKVAHLFGFCSNVFWKTTAPECSKFKARGARKTLRGFVRKRYAGVRMRTRFARAERFSFQPLAQRS